MMIRLFRSLYKLGGNAVIQSSLDLLVQMRGDFLLSRIFRYKTKTQGQGAENVEYY